MCSRRGAGHCHAQPPPAHRRASQPHAPHRHPAAQEALHKVGFALHSELAEELGIASYRRIPARSPGPREDEHGNAGTAGTSGANGE